MTTENHDFENYEIVKIDIGSPEYQVREELLQKIESVKKQLAEIESYFFDHFG